MAGKWPVFGPVQFRPVQSDRLLQRPTGAILFFPEFVRYEKLNSPNNRLDKIIRCHHLKKLYSRHSKNRSTVHLQYLDTQVLQSIAETYKPLIIHQRQFNWSWRLLGVLLLAQRHNLHHQKFQQHHTHITSTEI